MEETGFMSEVDMFAFNYAPIGWAECDGSTIKIRDHQGLFSLLGANFGGNGITDFALPQLEGRVPIGRGYTIFNSHYIIGATGGAEYVTLSPDESPQHSHTVYASSEEGNFLGNRGGDHQLATEKLTEIYAGPNYNEHSYLNPYTISHVGGGKPHYNVQPYLSVLFCIAIQGPYPSRD